MAVIDSLLEFDDGSTAVTASGDSEYFIDLSSDRDVGVGRPLYVVVAVKSIDEGNGDETYTFTVETDDNATFSSATDIMTLTIPRDTPVGNYVFGTLPSSNEQYLQGRWTLGGTTPSITANVYVTDQEPQSWQAYPQGQVN